MVLAQGQLQNLVEILEYQLIKHRGRLVPKNVQVAAQRDEIGLELRRDVLAAAASAGAVASAVVAVPVFVLVDVVDVFVVVGPDAKAAELAFALVVDVRARRLLAVLRLFRFGAQLLRKGAADLVKLLVKIRKKDFDVGDQHFGVVWVDEVRVQLKVLDPAQKLRVVLLEGKDVDMA